MKIDQNTWKETKENEQRPTGMKRDLYTWKKTIIHKKRPTNMKRDLQTWKETCIHEKRPTYMKKHLCTWKETNKYHAQVSNEWGQTATWSKATYVYEKRPVYGKRDQQHEKRPTNTTPRCPTNEGKLRLNVKRSMYMKRDLYMWKETYICNAQVKNPISIYWKRPIYMKRDLRIPRPSVQWITCGLGLQGTRSVYIQRDLCIWKETCMCEKRPIFVKRDLRIPRPSVWWITCGLALQGTRFMFIKRDLWLWKETCMCENRPMHTASKCYTNTVRIGTWGKDNYMRQKRPMYMKRDLHTPRPNVKMTKRRLGLEVERIVYIKRILYVWRLNYQQSIYVYVEISLVYALLHVYACFWHIAREVYT